jgi:hypothetical protein
MIKLESTGSPKEMAGRMMISERQLYNLLEQLRDMEAPIRFSRKANTYYYSGEFEFLVQISVQVIQGEQTRSIYAGKKISRCVDRLQGSCSGQGYLRYVKTKLDVVG